MEIIIQPKAADAADLVARLMQRTVQARPRAVLGLATGRTMESVYARLAQMHRQGGLDLSRCRTFNLDEYVGLPGGDPNSYRHYMNQHLFRPVNLDVGQTHVPDGAAVDLSAECEHYEKLIQDAGGIDLQLLGIGRSGHIGFNEPLSAFGSRTRVVTLAPATIEQNAPLFSAPELMPRQAITMGLGTILECRRCVLLATGRDKAEVVAAAVEGALTSMVPASVLQWHSDCVVVLDAAAASGLTKSEYYHWLLQNDPQWQWLRQALAKGTDVIPSLEQLHLAPAS